MSKYGNIVMGDKEPSEVFNMRMLQAIANELAEANRLKRMELQINIGNHVAEDKQENWLGECVDKA